MKFQPENLRKFRTDLGMSRKDVAVAFKKHKRNISSRTLVNWEAGISEPSAGDFPVMCSIFNKQLLLFFTPIEYRNTHV